MHELERKLAVEVADACMEAGNRHVGMILYAGVKMGFMDCCACKVKRSWGKSAVLVV